jgi:hypothetical protein
LSPPPYAPVYLPVPWLPLPPADPTTDSEPEDSGDPPSPPLSGVCTVWSLPKNPLDSTGSIPGASQGDRRAHVV